jgi:general secretion pathway protein C
MATVAETLRLDGELGSQLLARLPHAVALVLVVLIGVRGALFVADLAGGSLSDPLAPVAPAPAVRNVVDVPSILRANLFGQSLAATGGTAPVTSMQLVLAGVVAASDEKLGLALIGTNSATVEMKKVGDPLPGGATLHAVHVDRALINRGGAIEALLLPDVGSLKFAPPPPTQAAATAQTIGRIEQELRANPNIIAQVMHRTPVFSDGRLRGMRVQPGPNAAAFARLGLRNNDLVTAINGVELNDETRSREVFDSLAGAGEARVTVERGGAKQDLVLNLAEIAPEAERLATAEAAVEPPEPPAGASPPPDVAPPEELAGPTRPDGDPAR